MPRMKKPALDISTACATIHWCQKGENAYVPLHIVPSNPFGPFSRKFRIMISKWILGVAIAIAGAAGYGVNKFVHSHPSHRHLPIPAAIAASRGTENLILCCADHRFCPVISDWAEEELGNSADRVSWPGGSKTITEPAMRPHTIESLRLLVDKHHIKKIHLMNHLQCAGHPPQTEDQEMAYHRGELQKAVVILRHEIPGIQVICYVVGFDGIHRVD